MICVTLDSRSARSQSFFNTRREEKKNNSKQTTQERTIQNTTFKCCTYKHRQRHGGLVWLRWKWDNETKVVTLMWSLLVVNESACFSNMCSKLRDKEANFAVICGRFLDFFCLFFSCIAKADRKMPSCQYLSLFQASSRQVCKDSRFPPSLGLIVSFHVNKVVCNKQISGTNKTENVVSSSTPGWLKTLAAEQIHVQISPHTRSLTISCCYKERLCTTLTLVCHAETE